MSDEQYGSYPRYEWAEKRRETGQGIGQRPRTEAQQDKADADLALLQARSERFWKAEGEGAPLHRVHLIYALMARYEVLMEQDWRQIDGQREFIRQQWRSAIREIDPAIACKDWCCRFFAAYYKGLDGLAWLEDRAKGVNTPSEVA